MRHILLPLAILLCVTSPALAQVTVDLRALDALPALPEAPTRHPPPNPLQAPRPAVAMARPNTPAARPEGSPAQPTAGRPGVASAQSAAPRPSVASVQPAVPAAPSASAPPAGPSRAVALAQPTAPAPQAGAPPTLPAAPQPPPPPATVPAAPPPVASIAPIQPPAPPANPQAPPAPPIVAGAATKAAATATGLRLTFANDKSDLSPGSADSIKHFVQTAPSGDTTTFNVLAYASGDPNDPSVARRLSLERAIAVRSALMADGVPSSRIYLRALGFEPGRGPPDRVDLNVLGANASAQ
jgi:outer membrane protein OmpA-like peptidoglycan-associated protein